MIPRLRDRLAHLEAQIMPPPAARVFYITMDDQVPFTHDEQLAAFKAEKGVTPYDHLIVFSFQ
jgi:hypothetical protein